MQNVCFTMQDPIIRKTRMLLVQEQFINERISEVTTRHQLDGIQRMFRSLLEDFPNEKITLNSSPFGVVFYKAIGFVPTDEEKTVPVLTMGPIGITPELKRKGYYVKDEDVDEFDKGFQPKEKLKLPGQIFG